MKNLKDKIITLILAMPIFIIILIVVMAFDKNDLLKNLIFGV